MARKYLVLLGIALMLALSAAGVYADGRINMVHHFGGDALFCDLEDGCRALNMDGGLLWEVDQATIDAAMEAACESGVAQNIEAGQGTYGPMVIEVNCYGENGGTLKLMGYDEHGKMNQMPFAPNYAPVNAPVSHGEETSSGGKSEGNCEVDLVGYGYSSIDGIHGSEGWDVWDSTFNEFLYWTDSDPDLPDCFSLI